jgi:hypothetical protein
MSKRTFERGNSPMASTRLSFHRSKKMRRIVTGLGFGVLTLNLFTLAVAADSYTAPRIANGQPDLQGVWTNATQTPLERPRELGTKGFFTLDEAENQEQEWRAYIDARSAPSDPNRPPPTDGNTDLGYNNFWVDMGTNVIEINGQYRTSIIIDPPDGRIPYAEGALAKMMARYRSPTDEQGRGRYDGPEGRPLGERCLMSFGSGGGPPMLPVMYNNNYQIVQTEDYVVILVEMVHDARIIRLHDRPDGQDMPKWLGDSIGRYEGDTLVVQSSNFHAAQSFRGTSSDALITERFTRVAEDKIVYSFTVDDPAAFSRPFTGEIAMHQRPEGEKMYEYACHEGNYAMLGILAGERVKERAAAQ